MVENVQYKEISLNSIVVNTNNSINIIFKEDKEYFTDKDARKYDKEKEEFIPTLNHSFQKNQKLFNFSGFVRKDMLFLYKGNMYYPYIKRFFNEHKDLKSAYILIKETYDQNTKHIDVKYIPSRKYTLNPARYYLYKDSAEFTPKDALSKEDVEKEIETIEKQISELSVKEDKQAAVKAKDLLKKHIQYNIFQSEDFYYKVGRAFLNVLPLSEEIKKYKDVGLFGINETQFEIFAKIFGKKLLNTAIPQTYPINVSKQYESFALEAVKDIDGYISIISKNPKITDVIKDYAQILQSAKKDLLTVPDNVQDVNIKKIDKELKILDSKKFIENGNVDYFADDLKYLDKHSARVSAPFIIGAEVEKVLNGEYKKADEYIILKSLSDEEINKITSYLEETPDDKNIFLNSNFSILKTEEGTFLTNLGKKEKAIINENELDFNDKRFDDMLKKVSNKTSINKLNKEQLKIKKEKLEKIFEVYETVRNKTEEFFFSKSAVAKIQPNAKIFENLMYVNSNAEKVSIKEIVSNPALYDNFVTFEGYKNLISYIAKKANYVLPKNETFTVNPIDGTKNIPEEVKIEKISAKNLGMNKFGYIPTVDIRKEEYKDEIIKKFIKFFDDKIEDVNDAIEAINKGAFIKVVSEQKIDTKKETFEIVPVIAIYDEYAQKIAQLNLDIYQYADFLEQTGIVDYEDMITSPNPDLYIKSKISFSVAKMFSGFYKELLEENLLDAAKTAVKFLVRTNKGVTEVSFKHNKNARADFTELMNLFFEKLSNKNILNNTLEQIGETIRTMPISPVEKRRLTSIFTNAESIILDKSRIDKELAGIKTLFPEQEKELNEKIEKLREDVYSLVEKVEKEVSSFIYVNKLLNNIKEKTALPKEAVEQRAYITESAFNGIKKWGTATLGLMEEQIEDALNAIILSIKKDLNAVNFFHSMGTGKTRLAIMYMILENALQPEKGVYFAIQNKNRKDIDEQVEGMLPSFKYFINYYFSSNDSFVNNNFIPFHLVKTVFPNVLGSSLSNIYRSNEFQTKKDISEKAIDLLENFYSEIEDKNITELKETITSQNILKELSDYVDEAYKRIVKNELNKPNSTLNENSMQRHKHELLKSITSTVLFFNYLHKTGNLVDKAEEKIEKKLKNDVDKYLTSAVFFEKVQKNKKMGLIAQSFLDYFPREKETSIEEKISNIKITTTNDTDKFNIVKTNLKEKSFNQEDLYKETFKNISDFKYKNEETAPLHYPVNTPFYVRKAFIKSLAKVFGENKYDRTDIELLLQKIYPNEETFKGLHTEVSEIRINDMPLQTKGVSLDGIVLEKEKLIKKVLIAYKTDSYDSLDNVYKKIIDTLSDKAKLYNVLKKDFISEFYSTYTYPFSKAAKKSELAGGITLSGQDISMNVKVKSSLPMPYKTEENFGICYVLNSEKKLISDDLEEYPEIKIPTEFKVNFSKKEYGIVFDSTVKKEKKAMLNTSMFFIPKDNLNSTLIIDEAHKNKERNTNILKKLNGKKVSLTGTPTNGTPYSLTDIMFYSLSDNERRTIAKKITLSGGNQSIKNPLALTGYSNKKIREYFHTLAKSIDMSVFRDDSEAFRIFLDKVYKDVAALNTEENASKITKYLGGMYYNDFRALTKMFIRLKEKPSVVEDAMEFFAQALNQTELKVAPGFSNPHNIAKWLNYPKDIETSVKEGDRRVYNLIGIDKIFDKRLIPKNKEELYDYAMDHNLFDLQILYSLLLKQPGVSYIRKLGDAIDEFVNNVFFAGNEQVKEEILEAVNDRILFTGEKHFKDINELMEFLTPKTFTFSDTLGIFTKERLLDIKVDNNLRKVECAKAVIDYLYNDNKFFELLKKDEKLEERLEEFEKIDELNKIKNDYKIDEYLLNVEDVKRGTPVVTELNVDLSKHFDGIFTDSAFMKIKLFSPVSEEIINEMVNEAAQRVVNNAAENKNSLLFTTRINLLLLKAAETIHRASKQKLEKPFYIIVNSPTSEEFDNFFKNLDYKALADKNIFIIKSNPLRLYNDYNYGIPKDANFTIISNYSSAAEGFRFPKANETIYTGLPVNIATLVQSSARVFFPNKVFKSNIVLNTGGLTYDLSNIKIRELKNIAPSVAERVNKYYTPDTLTLLQEHIMKEPEYIKREKANNELKNIINGRLKDKSDAYKEKLTDIADGYIASLKFVGANFKGVENRLPEKLIKEFFTNKEKEGINLSRKIKK